MSSNMKRKLQMCSNKEELIGNQVYLNKFNISGTSNKIVEFIKSSKIYVSLQVFSPKHKE